MASTLGARDSYVEEYRNTLQQSNIIIMSLGKSLVDLKSESIITDDLPHYIVYGIRLSGQRRYCSERVG